MKLALSLLTRFIDLPSNNAQELRGLLDDLGLEVKDLITDRDESIFTIETLANRGDHLCALGVARELSARLLSPVRQPTLAGKLDDRPVSLPIRIKSDKCLRYAALELSLPDRLVLRPEILMLRERAGLAKLHELVEALNYVQAEIGQPMHAFDRDKLDGEISVVTSEQAEQVQGLDGNTYTVPAGSVLICDRTKVVAVAGVIGCANSMVDANSRRVIVESATFDPVTVRKTAKAMGLATEASHAFERGVDPEMSEVALRRLAHLLGSITGAEGARVLGCSISAGQAIAKRQIPLSLKKLRDEFALPRLQETQVSSRLKYLGFNLQAIEKPEGWLVEVPSWRLWDVYDQADLVEDFVRVHGFNNIKLVLPQLSLETAPKNQVEQMRSALEPALHGAGFCEVITRSFLSADESALLASYCSSPIKLKNALEKNNACLRSSLIVHLAKLAEENHRRGVAAFKVYELARVFAENNNLVKSATTQPYQYERDVLALAFSGRWKESEWRARQGGNAANLENLLLFKGVLENIVASVNCKLEIRKSQNCLLHPGQQAGIAIGTEVVGYFGSIHPQLAKSLDLRQSLIYAELDVEALSRAVKGSNLNFVSDFPSIKRDLTLQISATEWAGEAQKLVINSQKKLEVNERLLDFVEIIDTFQKEGEAFRRVSYRLTFASKERTLSSGEVDQSMQQIMEMLNKKGYELAR